MFRVWTCLALAMTTGAVLLSWLERGAPVAATPWTAAELQAAATSAVGEHREGLAPWSGIVLVGVAGQAGPGGLTATRPNDDVHFVLTAQGRVYPQPSWYEQRTLDANGGIRIGLAAVRTARAEEQIRALRHLIDVLNQVVAKECRRELPSAVPLRIAVEASPRDRALMEAVVRQLQEIWVVDRA